MIWKIRNRTLDLRHRARVMGILNTTPDSFSDGGLHAAIDAALAHARAMIAEGAEIIDIGGESTRPGADPVDATEEIRRTVPVIRALRAEWEGFISIDTMKASVAAAALDAGADIVNDVSGLTADPEMTSLCASTMCGVVVMHMRGTPRTMQHAPVYDDVVAEVAAWLAGRHDALCVAGLDAAALCYDPGIGFGKTLDHNLALLRNLDKLAPAERPLLLGVSRKSCIAGILGEAEIEKRDWPTVAITAVARDQGVMLHRVHAVRPNVDALRMIEAVHAIPHAEEASDFHRPA
ncbi:MAG: dihydropteroate synthase [Luteolibacter sp.]|jgi:dihydropteroate synthase